MRVTFSTFVTPTREREMWIPGADACRSGTWGRRVGSIHLGAYRGSSDDQPGSIGSGSPRSAGHLGERPDRCERCAPLAGRQPVARLFLDEEQTDVVHGVFGVHLSDSPVAWWIFERYPRSFERGQPAGLAQSDAPRG